MSTLDTSLRARIQTVHRIDCQNCDYWTAFSATVKTKSEGTIVLQDLGWKIIADVTYCPKCAASS